MKSFYLFIFCLFSVPILGQGITQNTEGSSTILMHGTNVSLDISNAELGLNLNTLYKTIGDTSSLFLGAEATGKNENGFSSLFDNGYFVPSSSLKFYGGLSFSNGFDPANEKKVKELLNKREKVKEIKYELLVKSLSNKLLNSDLIEVDSILFKDIKNLLAKKARRDIIQKRLEQDTNRVLSVRQLKEKMLFEIEMTREEETTQLDQLNKEIINIYSLEEKKDYWQFLVFGFASVEGISFKKYAKIDTNNLVNNINTESFRGGNIGVGINLRYNRFTFGMTYSYSNSSNFSTLTPTELTLRETIVSGNQTLVQDKKIVAYSGKYGSSEHNRFNFDILGNFKISDKTHILVNPYFKSILFSRRKDFIPDIINLGLGLYLFSEKNQLLGGIYVELPDVNNEIENTKPLEERNFRAPINRLSIGIVSKISIQSLFQLTLPAKSK